MSIIHDIARGLTAGELDTLARFRAAAERHEALPAALNELPMGFLSCVGLDEQLRVLHVLSPLGKRVALAAEDIAAEDAAE